MEVRAIKLTYRQHPFTGLKYTAVGIIIPGTLSFIWSGSTNKQVHYVMNKISQSLQNSKKFWHHCKIRTNFGIFAQFVHLQHLTKSFALLVSSLHWLILGFLYAFLVQWRNELNSYPPHIHFSTFQAPILFFVWLTMKSQIESTRLTQYTLLYENE